MPVVRTEPEQGATIERSALSPSEAATSLGVSRAYLYNLLTTGRLASVKCGRRRLIRPAAIEQYLDELAEAQS